MHVDADTLKVKDCPWYDRGFCKHGKLLINNDNHLLLLQVLPVGTDTQGESCVRNIYLVFVLRGPAVGTYSKEGFITSLLLILTYA